MAKAIATLSNFRQSPRKMRLVANLVKGKKVAEALVNLEFTTKRASLPIKTLISSALANAKAMGLETDNLVVKKIEVNPGKIMYRRIPAARGSAHPLRKRTSHISVELDEAGEKTKKSKVAKEDKKVTKEVSEKVTKKSVAKKAKK